MSNYEIVVRKGSVIGRQHVTAGKNNQDHAVIRELGEYSWLGISSDGCSSGGKSEIASFLISEILGNRVRSYYLNGETPVWSIQASYQDVLSELDHLVGVIDPDVPSDFVFNTLRATVMGVFHLDEIDKTIIFYQGDGKYFIDGEVTNIDQQNTPTYMVYELPQVANQMPQIEGLGGFNIVMVNPNWRRIAVASDGVPDFVFSEIWGEKHKASLQRKLNVLSDARTFSDDATIVAFERFGGKNEEMKDEAEAEIEEAYNHLFAIAQTMSS